MKTQSNTYTDTSTPAILDCGHAPDPGQPANVNGRTVMGWRFVLTSDGRKVCHACDMLRVLPCGHHPSPHSPCFTGTARLPDGREICCACVDDMQREDLRDTSKPFDAYLSCDGKTVTTWTGGQLMRVTQSWPCALTRQSWIHSRSSYKSIRAIDCHGQAWHGRGSAGTLIRLRACKAHAPATAAAR